MEIYRGLTKRVELLTYDLDMNETWAKHVMDFTTLGLFTNRKKFESTLAEKIIWENFQCSKSRNIKKIILPPGHTGGFVILQGTFYNISSLLKRSETL